MFITLNRVKVHYSNPTKGESIALFHFVLFQFRSSLIFLPLRYVTHRMSKRLSYRFLTGTNKFVYGTRVQRTRMSVVCLCLLNDLDQNQIWWICPSESNNLFDCHDKPWTLHFREYCNRFNKERLKDYAVPIESGP